MNNQNNKRNDFTKDLGLDEYGFNEEDDQKKGSHSTDTDYEEAYDDEFDEDYDEDEDEDYEEENNEGGAQSSGGGGGGKKIGGVSYGIMLGLAMVKDTTDVLTTLAQILLPGLDLIIPGVGSSLSLLVGILAYVIGAMITFTIFLYLKFSGVKFTSKKLATATLSTIIEMIPLVDILPTTTIMLVLVKKMQNNERVQKLAKIKARV